VTTIFCMRVSSESNHKTESAGPLVRRSSLPGPLDGDIGANVMVTLGIGVCGEAPQVGAFRLEGEPARPANRDVCVDSLDQHGCTSGQGWAI
jgi:hypothetical protein